MFQRNRDSFFCPYRMGIDCIVVLLSQGQKYSIKIVLICVLKMIKGLMGLEQHEGE